MPKKHNWQKRGNSVTLHVCIGTDITGRPIRYTKTVPYTTDAQIDKEWERFYMECEDGKHTRQKKMTVNQMITLVMEERIKKTAKRTTIKGYMTDQFRIRDSIGKFRLKDIKPPHIQHWVNEMAEKISPKSVKNTYSFLKMCFDIAVGWDLIAESPCHHIKLPRIEKKEVQILTSEELPAFLTAIDNISEEQYDYKVAILMALFGGMRRGEICGLEEEDVDFENGCVKIRKTLNVVAKEVYEDIPKTKSSVRTVYFPKEIMSEMKKLILLHKEKQLMLGTKWEGSTKLIKGYFGSDMYPDNLWNYLNRFLKANNMRHISFHALRHTHSSMMISLGKSLQEVSKQLGHAQQSTTLDIYTHLFKDADKAKKETAQELSEAFLQQIYNK